MKAVCLATLASLLVATSLAWDEAHVTGYFYCSVLPHSHWIPSSTHLKFWDKGRVWDNVLKEFNLNDRNQTVDVTLNNGALGLRPYLTIKHFCDLNNDPKSHVLKLKLGENYLGNVDLYKLD